MRKSMRTAAIGAAVVAAVVGMAGTAGAAGPAGTAERKPPLPIKAVAPEGDPVAAAARAYRTVYPQMSASAARTAARQQDDRKALQTELVAGANAATFGGAWYDPPTGTVHVAATTAAAGRRAVLLGDRLGLTVTTHRVARSFSQLEAQADTLRTGTGTLAKAATGVGIDVKTNSVVVDVAPAAMARLKSSAEGGLRVGARSAGTPVEDAGCTARNACDYTIRAGSMIWRTSVGNNQCSVGFTGRQTNNQRWVYTAGHCSNGNGVLWGTGAQSIGPMYASVNTGPYDVSIIQVTNPWFASDAGGEIYQTALVNGVAPTLSYIWPGDSVCLSANFTVPTGGNFCGVVNTNSDAAVRGMVRVDGLDACPGDSGGGWYWLTSTGRRIAYGVHSQSDLGCHGDGGGSHSWFSPLPTIKAGWTPWLNVETRP